ncbi:MAG: hypothetical protein V2A71_02330 [Candidatus Eisenbacteria bacterium]
MYQLTDVLRESYTEFFGQLAGFLPNLIGAIVILIVGWIVARVIKGLVIKSLKVVRFNVLTEKAGVEKFLRDGGVKISACETVGVLLYWLVMLIVLSAAFNSLGLRIASELFNEIILFVPNVVVAVLVLIVGLYLARFMYHVVVTYFKNIGVENAETFGRIAKWGILIFVLSVTLFQLNVGAEIVRGAFLIIFGAVALALALAFGLGGRDSASRIIKDYWKK